MASQAGFEIVETQNRVEAAPGFEPGITVLQGEMRRMSKLLRLQQLFVQLRFSALDDRLTSSLLSQENPTDPICSDR